MNAIIPNWITCHDGVTLGFDTMEDALAFIKSQSINVDWQEQWTFCFAKTPLGKQVVKASTLQSVILYLKQEPPKA